MPLDPVSFLLDGGAGGLNISPSSSSNTGAVSNKLSFGNSIVGSTPGGSVLPLAVTAATFLFGLYIWKKVK